MKGTVRQAIFFLLMAALVIAVTELAARAIFTNMANDDVYLERAFERLLNSAVRFEPGSDNYSRKYGFALTPNAESTATTKEFTYTSRTNSLGFRTRETQPKAAGEYRVLLLGDSFFWGIGVEESETIPAIMEGMGGQKLSVYNYSVVGYNTVQQLIVANHHVSALRPDHIVLGFFIGNDIISNAITYVDSDGNYGVSGDMEAQVKDRMKQSYGTLFHSVIFRIVALPFYIPKVRYQIASSEHVIARSYAHIVALRDLAARDGARFSVVILYPRDSVRGGLVEAWSDSRKVGELIHSFCRAHSVEVLDMLRYMHTREHKNLYFFEDDGHPNKDGNAVIAKAILDDLLKQHIPR